MCVRQTGTHTRPPGHARGLLPGPPHPPHPTPLQLHSPPCVACLRHGPEPPGCSQHPQWRTTGTCWSQPSRSDKKRGHSSCGKSGVVWDLCSVQYQYQHQYHSHACATAGVCASTSTAASMRAYVCDRGRREGVGAEVAQERQVGQDHEESTQDGQAAGPRNGEPHPKLSQASRPGTGGGRRWGRGVEGTHGRAGPQRGRRGQQPTPGTTGRHG